MFITIKVRHTCMTSTSFERLAEIPISRELRARVRKAKKQDGHTYESFITIMMDMYDQNKTQYTALLNK